MRKVVRIDNLSVKTLNSDDMLSAHVAFPTPPADCPLLISANPWGPKLFCEASGSKTMCPIGSGLPPKVTFPEIWYRLVASAAPQPTIAPKATTVIGITRMLRHKCVVFIYVTNCAQVYANQEYNGALRH